ncbi:MAG: CAP domain-containing protein [Dehalococcoidia bacterium]
MPFERPVLSGDRMERREGTLVRSRSPLAAMPVVLSGAEERFLEEQQRVRAAAGAPPLRWLPALTRVARGRCDQMPIAGPVHFAAGGERSYVPLLEALGVDFRAAGENIAATAGERSAEDDVARIVEMMLANPSQRSNLLDAGYTGLGVGVVEGGGARYWTSIFVRSEGRMAGDRGGQRP